MTKISPFTSAPIKDNPKSIANHLKGIARTTGKTYAEAALRWAVHFGGDPAAACEVCSNQKTFQSLKTGFVCMDSECKKRRTEIRISNCINSLHQHRSRPRIDVDNRIDFIIQNAGFYQEHYKSKTVIDLYDNQPTKNITLGAHLARKLGKSPYTHPQLQKLGLCAVCGTEYSFFILRHPPNTCGGRSCRLVGLGNSDNVLARKEAKKLISKYLAATPLSTLIEETSTIRGDILNETIKSYGVSTFDALRIKAISRISGLGVILHDGIELLSLLSHNRQTLLTKQLEMIYGAEQSSIEALKIDALAVNCRLCGVRHHRYASHGKKLSFCSTECYHLSLTQKYVEVMHPGLRSKSSIKSRSDSMKRKILSGEFTPHASNSWCKSRVEVMVGEKVVPCRSAWDATFLICNPELEYETLRIPYVNSVGVSRVYIVDFVDRVNCIMYEIKPDGNKDDPDVKLKEQAAILWGNTNGYKFEFIGNSWFEQLFSSKEYNHRFEVQPSAELILRRMKQFIKGTL